MVQKLDWYVNSFFQSKEADLLMQNKSEYEAHLSQARIRKQKFHPSV